MGKDWGLDIQATTSYFHVIIHVMHATMMSNRFLLIRDAMCEFRHFALMKKRTTQTRGHLQHCVFEV